MMNQFLFPYSFKSSNIKKRKNNLELKKIIVPLH